MGERDILKIAGGIARDAENRARKEEIRNKIEASEAAKRCLYEMTISGFLEEHQANIGMANLASGFEELMGEGQLFVGGENQDERVSVSNIETPCGRRAVSLTVGPKFTEQFKIRPDAMRAELIFNMGRAVFVEAGIERVGEFTTFGQVREAVKEYLRTIPIKNLTREQMDMLK